MAETTYPYTIASDLPGGALNSEKLDAEIRASAITIALNRVDTAGGTLNIVFNAALPAADKTLLDGDVAGPAGGLLAAHDNTPSPNKAEAHAPFSDNSVEFKATGIMATVSKGTEGDIDLAIGTEARLLNGGHLYAQQGVVGDTITAQIVDVDNLLGQGANFVVKEWIKDWYIIPDLLQHIRTPQAGEVPAGLYVRLKYKSTGTANDVKVLINYDLYKKL